MRLQVPSRSRTDARNTNLRLQPLRSICNQSVSLENAKTEEHGLAIHEECYMLRLKLKRATKEDIA